MPQYVSRDAVEAAVLPEILGLGSRPLRLAERSSADDWPIALELRLASRVTRLRHDEFGWWILWLLQPVGNEKTHGPRSPLRYARHAAVMRRIVAAGIRLETEYASGTFTFPEEEDPVSAGSPWSRLPGLRAGGHRRAREAMCRFILADPVSPFHGLRSLPSVRECLGSVGVIGHQDARRREPAKMTRIWAKSILDQGPLPHLGDPPLHISTLNAYLLPVDRFGNSLLDLAALVGNLDAINTFVQLMKGQNEFFLNHGKTVGPVSIQTSLERPLHLAIIHGQERIVRLLLDTGVRAPVGSIHAAARGGHVGVLRQLVRTRADLEARIQGDLVGSIPPSGRSHPCTDCDPDREDFELGLHETCCPTDDALVKRALEARRDELTLRCDPSREAALLTAFGSGTAFRRIVLGTEEAYAAISPLPFNSLDRVFRENDRGPTDLHLFYPFKTPLMIAAEYGREEVVAELIGKGADVNAGPGGLTALVYAAKYGYIEIAERLLQAGATLTDDRLIEDDVDVLTPFADGDACARNPALFAQAGQRIRTRWFYRQTHHPLRNAVREGHLQLTRLLLSLMQDFRYRGVVSSALYEIAEFEVLDYSAIRRILKHHLDQRCPVRPSRLAVQ